MNIWTVPGRRDVPPPLCGWGQRDGIWPTCESRPTWYWTSAWWAAEPGNQEQYTLVQAADIFVSIQKKHLMKISKLMKVQEIKLKKWQVLEEPFVLIYWQIKKIKINAIFHINFEEIFQGKKATYGPLHWLTRQQTKQRPIIPINENSSKTKSSTGDTTTLGKQVPFQQPPSLI